MAGGQEPVSDSNHDAAQDDEFLAVIGAGYAEPTTIMGAVGDDEITRVAPTPRREGVDLGVAGSLVQTWQQLRAERRTPGRWPLRRVVLAVTGLVVAAGGVVAIATGWLGVELLAIVFLGLAVFAFAAAQAFGASRRATEGERRLGAVIAAEQNAGRQLASALAGTGWVLLHDRRLPNTEHRVPFLCVGPAGVVVVSMLPPGPYLILEPAGVRAGESELAFGWMPTRIWEVRYLVEALTTTEDDQLHFRGPVFPVAVEAYPRATQLPVGWSAEPPYRIDDFHIRRPGPLAEFLCGLPTTFAPHHVRQLTELVDQHCPPAPTLDQVNVH